MDEHTEIRPAKIAEARVEFERQFKLFTILWAVATFVTVWRRIEVPFLTSDLASWASISLFVSALLLIARPAWTTPLLFSCVLHFGYSFWLLPGVTSPDLLWLFFGGTVIASFVTRWAITRSPHVNCAALFRSFAPCLRIMTLLVIVATAGARANLVFIDQASSPVTQAISTSMTWEAPSRWVIYLIMSSCLFVDLAIAIGLVIPSLRRFAVGFGSFYFCLQAVLGLPGATWMLPQLLVGLYLFASPSLIARMYERIFQCLPNRKKAIPFAGAVLVLLVACFLMGQDSGGSTHGDPLQEAVESSETMIQGFRTLQPVHLLSFLPWVYFAALALWLVLILSSLVSNRSRLTWISLMIRNPLHVALLALMLLAVASPYLGLGNLGRFTDQSGLVTGGGSNHLLIPTTSVSPMGMVVEIMRSSDPHLQQLADERSSIFWIDFVDYIAEHPNTSVTFIRGEEQFVIDHSGAVEELSIKPNWLYRKFCAFSPITHRVGLPRIVAQP